VTVTAPDQPSADTSPLSRIGLWSGVLDRHSPAEARALIARFEAQGWASFWYGESYGREAFTNALLMLGATERITIGTGIANIYARDAVAMNAAGRSVADQYPGRFVNGIGVSHRPLVEGQRKGSYLSPIATMRDYLRGMKEATYLAHGEERPPVVVAALGPKMLELSRDEADGAHPYLVVPAHTAQAREILGPDKLLIVEQGVVLANDEEQFRSRAASHLNTYTGLPNYRNSWLRQGFEESDFVRGGSTRLQDAMVARGEDAIRARVQEHLDAGADEVLLQIIGDQPGDMPVADAERLAQAFS
jgi:probable F420-dependent oxidoreductase